TDRRQIIRRLLLGLFRLGRVLGAAGGHFCLDLGLFLRRQLLGVTGRRDIVNRHVGRRGLQPRRPALRGGPRDARQAVRDNMRYRRAAGQHAGTDNHQGRDPYGPERHGYAAAWVSASTMPSTSSSTRNLSSPSPMTRMTGSVPDGRMTRRPWPLRRVSAFSMVERTV